MIITVVLYATSGHVDFLSGNRRPFDQESCVYGLAIRTEEVVTAEKAGYIEYYASEGMQVRKEGSVYSLSNEEQKQVTASLTEEQMENVRSSASQFSYAYNSNHFYDTYSYKYQVRGTILQAVQESQSTSAETGSSVQDDTSDEEEGNTGEDRETANKTSGESEEQTAEDKEEQEEPEEKVISVGNQDVYTAPEAGIVHVFYRRL